MQLLLITIPGRFTRDPRRRARRTADGGTADHGKVEVLARWVLVASRWDLEIGYPRKSVKYPDSVASYCTCLRIGGSKPRRIIGQSSIAPWPIAVRMAVSRTYVVTVSSHGEAMVIVSFRRARGKAWREMHMRSQRPGGRTE